MIQAKQDIVTYFDSLAGTYATWLTPVFTKLRAQLVSRFVQGTVLDVGVGRGELLNAYSSSAESVIGCDFSCQMIIVAQKANPTATLFVSSAESLDYQEQTFETIVLSEVIYYISDVKFFLQKAYSWLKPQGKIIIIFGNARYNFLYPFLGKLGLRLPDKFGERTLSLSTIQKQIRAALPAVAVSCYGGMPFIGWSEGALAKQVFSLQAMVVTRLTPK